MKTKLAVVIILLLIAITALIIIGVFLEIRDAQRDPLATCFRKCEDKYVDSGGAVADEYNYGKCVDECLRANVCAD